MRAWTFSVLAVDITAPIINGCPSSDTYPTTFAMPSRSVTWTPPTATDSSGVTVMSTHQPGDIFSVGTTPVVYTFTDSFGNSAQCDFTVTGN